MSQRTFRVRGGVALAGMTLGDLVLLWGRAETPQFTKTACLAYKGGLKT